jgi:hypothetical protein
MKAILEFNLEDPEDAQRHLRCIKALDMACVLFDLKHIEMACNKGDYSEEQHKVIESIFNDIRSSFDEYNVNIEELI